MKRRICVLMAAVIVTLSLSSCAGVKAEKNDFYADVTSLAEAFEDLEVEDPVRWYWEHTTLSELLEKTRSGQAPDLIRVFKEIDAFKKAGAIVPFTPSEKLVKDFETMPPFVREALREDLVTEDGRFWGCIEGGLPLGVVQSRKDISHCTVPGQL